MQWIAIYYNIFTWGRARDTQHRQQHCRNCRRRRCPIFRGSWPPKDLHAPSHLQQVSGLQPLRTFGVDMSQTFWSVFQYDQYNTIHFGHCFGGKKIRTFKHPQDLFPSLFHPSFQHVTAFIASSQSVIVMFTTLLTVLRWPHQFFSHNGDYWLFWNSSTLDFQGPLMLNS